ncbi:hypothetical protein D3C75_785530 [compost metagenome]
MSFERHIGKLAGIIFFNRRCTVHEVNFVLGIHFGKSIVNVCDFAPGNFTHRIKALILLIPPFREIGNNLPGMVRSRLSGPGSGSGGYGHKPAVAA